MRSGGADGMTTGERRQTAGAAQSVQALVAELTILRHGIGAVREVTTEWLPGMLGLLLRVTDLAGHHLGRCRGVAEGRGRPGSPAPC